MCNNELKVGQLRKSARGVVREILAVGATHCFVRTMFNVPLEEAISHETLLACEVVTKYHDFMIDEPVMAHFMGAGPSEPAVPRHFAGVDEHGLPLVWRSGTTSHTARAFFGGGVSGEPTVVVAEVYKV